MQIEIGPLLTYCVTCSNNLYLAKCIKYNFSKLFILVRIMVEPKTYPSNTIHETGIHQSTVQHACINSYGQF